MKTRKNFKAQTLSKREMRELNGGWIGWVVAAVAAYILIEMGDSAAEVKTGEYKCECCKQG